MNQYIRKSEIITIKPSKFEIWIEPCRALNVLPYNLAIRKCYLLPVASSYIHTWIMSDSNKRHFIPFMYAISGPCKKETPRKVVRKGHRILRKRLTSGKRGEFQWGLFEDFVKGTSACSDRFSENPDSPR